VFRIVRVEHPRNDSGYHPRRESRRDKYSVTSPLDKRQEDKFHE